MLGVFVTRLVPRHIKSFLGFGMHYLMPNIKKPDPVLFHREPRFAMGQYVFVDVPLADYHF
jgi:hypothetical protein